MKMKTMIIWWLYDVIVTESWWDDDHPCHVVNKLEIQIYAFSYYVYHAFAKQKSNLNSEYENRNTDMYIYAISYCEYYAFAKQKVMRKWN